MNVQVGFRGQFPETVAVVELKDGVIMDDAVLIVAMADKLSNMRSTKAGLALVGERHWERFNMHDVSQHAWYMRSLVAVFEPRLGHTIAWHELRDVVEEVFAGV